MRRTSPAKAAAKRYALAHVEHRGTTSDKHLPPIRVMASRAGVSYVSMWKAIRELSDEGLVRVNHKHGTTVVGRPLETNRSAAQAHPPPAPASHARKRKWQRLVSTIERELLDGSYPAGTLLPAAKELTRRYGVCHATLRQALDHMRAGGWLRYARRRYSVPPLRSNKRHGGIILVARGDRNGRPMLPTNRSQDHFRWLEAECGRSGLQLDRKSVV